MKIIKCKCGKTIAIETETTIEIKCTGKRDGKRCEIINVIKKNK